MDNSTIINSDHPEPFDFDIYFPYACLQLQMPVAVCITRQIQTEYLSAAKLQSKNKQSKSRVQLSSNMDKTSEDEHQVINTQFSDGVINILSYYDFHENLLQLRFYRNKKIPCTMIKLLTVLVKFYGYLNTITFDSGLNKHSLEELNNCLLLSNVTEINLDDTKIVNGEYHILLLNDKIRQLSLRRCNINDLMIEQIASHLHYPEKSSETLTTLNLATNRITDEGVQHLASALRTNRNLSYLNLCDNMITDEGGVSILNTLTEFLMTTEEILTSKRRLFEYYREREALIAKYLGEGKIPNASIIKSKKKKTGLTDKKVKLEENLIVTKRDEVTDEIKLYEAATEKVDKELGAFIDPFSNKNTIVKDEFRYCLGNTKLCYLNLAYNNLSLVFVNKLIKVLKYQKTIQKTYTGLVSVKIDGNCLPIYCAELQSAGELLQAAVLSCMDKPKNKK